MWRIFLPHNLFYFLRSLLYFIFCKKRDVNILFYSSSHFNRGLNLNNHLFQPLIDVSVKNHLSFLVFEEPAYEHNVKRREQNIKSDFIIFFIIIFRKLLKGSSIEKDKKIGVIFHKIFLKNKVANIVVLSQSLISFFRGAYPEANIYDYQHGVVYSDHKGYIDNNKVPDNLLLNNAKVLTFGRGFRDVLIKYNTYYEKNSFVIGVGLKKRINKTDNTNKVLVTLQFTEDHSIKENQILMRDLMNFIALNDQYQFLLKHHPRYNGQIKDDLLNKLPNVSFVTLDLSECLELCSVHVTAYSTTIFEAAASGIPSVFYSDFKSKIYIEGFKYPIPNSLNKVSEKSVFFGEIAYNWQKQYFETINENQWVSLMK